MRNISEYRKAFTLVEVIMVVVILGIIAAMAVPMYTSAASVQLSAAANMVATDLEYAKSMAISSGKVYQVVFDTGAESYSVKNSAGTVVSHPARVGQNYTINFASDSRLSKVDITSTSFPSGTIKFDYLGTPLDSSGAALNSASLVLTSEGRTMTVVVEAITGYITIQ